MTSLPEPDHVWPSHPRPEWIIPTPENFSDLAVSRSFTSLPRPGGSLYELAGPPQALISIRQASTFILVPLATGDDLLQAIRAALLWDGPGASRFKGFYR